jgi:hypothetical protein
MIGGANDSNFDDTFCMMSVSRIALYPGHDAIVKC